MVVQHPAHLAGGREGPARRDGAAADQPPARLPGLRQGRRVPAAEPGDEQRPGDGRGSSTSSAPSRSRSGSPPRCCSTASAASCASAAPGSPRRSRATRSSTCRCAASSSRSARSRRACSASIATTEGDADRSTSRASRSLATSPATRSRSARSARSPARRTGSAPARSTWSRPRAVCEHCASGCALRIDHRRGIVLRRLAGDDPAVNEEWNCDKGRCAFTWASGADRLSHPLVRDAEAGELEAASWPEALEAAARGLQRRVAPDRHRGAATGGVGVLHRRPAHRRGRLRLRASSPGSRSAPTTSTSASRAHSAEEADFLGHAVAGARGLARASPTRDLEAAPAVLLVGAGARGGVADRLPAAAQGGAARTQRVSTRRPVGHPRRSTKLRARPARRRPRAPRPRCSARSAPATSACTRPPTAARAPRVPSSWSASGCARPRRADRRAAAGRGHRRPAGLGAAPRRRARRGRGRRAARPAARRPAGRPTPRPGSTSPPPGASGRCPPSPVATPPRSSPPPRSGELGGLVVGGVDLDDLPDPAAARAALGRVPFVVSLEVRGQRGHRVRRRRAAGRAAGREGRHLPGLGGPLAALRRRPWPATRCADHRVLRRAGRRARRRPRAARRRRAVRGELAELGAWEGARVAAPTVAVAEPAARRAAGEAVLATWHLLLDAGRRPGRRAVPGRHRAPRRTRGCRRPPPPRSASRTAAPSPCQHGRRHRHRCRSWSPTCRTAWSWLPEQLARAAPYGASLRRRRRVAWSVCSVGAPVTCGSSLMNAAAAGAA